MPNQYETFRDTVKSVICASCVKQSADKSAIAYNWSMDRVFTACGEACKFENTTRLPGDFKEIVRFEFNKFKDSVMSKDGWTHLRSRESFAFTIDGVELRRTDTHANAAISLETQIAGARSLLDKCAASLAKADKGTTRYQQLSKRQSRLVREIDFLKNEIERQSRLSAEVNKSNASSEVQSEVTAQ